LARGDFADFAKQLEGLAAIYQINADKKQKGKVFQALQSLEIDLMALAEIQSFIKEPHNLVHKSPVGILEKRKGGNNVLILLKLFYINYLIIILQATL